MGCILLGFTLMLIGFLSFCTLLKLESYLGMDYSTYAESAVELCAAAEREAAALAQRKKTMQKSIEEMINKARESRDDKRLKQAAARKKKLAALDALGGLSSAPAADPTIRLQLPSAEPLGFYGSVLQVVVAAVEREHNAFQAAFPPTNRSKASLDSCYCCCSG